MIFKKLSLLGICAAALCSATPIEYIFTGTGTGSVGNTTFSDAPFAIEFFTNTGALVYGTTTCGEFNSNCSMPSDPVTNSFLIGSNIRGSISSSASPAAFLSPTEESVGIWFFGSPNDLPAENAALATDKSTSDTGSSGAQAASNAQQTNSPGIAVTYSVNGGASSSGDLGFTSVSNVSLQAVASNPAIVAVTPEPSTFLMLGLGMLMLAGKFRRKRV